MNRLFFITCLLSIIIINSGCETPFQPNKILFNSEWQFALINEENLSDHEINNQGTDWSSQYNVTYVSSKLGLGISEEEIKTEFNQLDVINWESITLPHTPKIENLTVKNQWQGICYYKKEFVPNKNWKGKICYIEFEGAMHLADIWINGKHISQHAGGYTPFVIDVSKLLKWDETNEILVRLDNKNNPVIPPGKPVQKLDFNYYGGIYRDVNFIVKNKIHITHPILANKVASGGVFVTYPYVEVNKAVINIQTHIQNESDSEANFEVKQHLIEINGLFQERVIGKEKAVTVKEMVLLSGKDKQIKQIIELDNPNLWSPDSPYLYILRAEIIDNGKIIDTEERRIGIRRINYSVENGFEINGKKLRLVGSNRHMEYPYIGNAISDKAQYRDIYHIKENGFNTVRLGHYVQDKSVLDACDELGLLAIEPIPGWQFFNKDNQFIELTYRDIRDMIRRDRNHPSIIMWEVILNESWPPKWWKVKANKIAHDEYPGDQGFTSGDSYGFFGWDIQYNDWEQGFKRPNNSGKPGFIREYYDYEFGGHNSTTRIKRGDGEEALLQNSWNAQWSHNRYRAYYPWTVGDAVWSMYDYNRGCCDNICHSGISDIFRIDKFSVPFYKSQFPVGTNLPSGKFEPYIFVANYWDNQPKDDKIIVYANVDEVTLEINGEQIARKASDNGHDTDYGDDEESWYNGGNLFDGGNSKQLQNAPFTFNDIKWKSGDIKAIGYIDGTKVCEHIVKTPKAPSHIKIDYFEAGKHASKNDVLIVYVSVLDANQTLCVNDLISVQLEALKGGHIVGPNSVLTEAGIASFLVKTNESNQLELKAKSKTGEESKILELNDLNIKLYSK